MGLTESKNANPSKNQASSRYDDPEADYDDKPETEEDHAFMVSCSIVSLKGSYNYTRQFRDPNYMWDLKAKGLTTPEKFVTWWNEKHPDCKIIVESLRDWSYRDGQNPMHFNLRWNEYE